MRLALLGYGNVGKAIHRLLLSKQAQYPFRITSIHTARHGTAYDVRGLRLSPSFGSAAGSIDEFLDQSNADVLVEITTLNPATGEPAISHLRAAFARTMHVITANKGPIAHAFAQLSEEARQRNLQFRFESTVMDGTPVFNNVRNNLPGVEVLGFSGVLNSTSKVVLATMQQGFSREEGVRRAQAMGIAEADASFDLDGWDSAAKTAALANVLMAARVTPQDVRRKGLGALTPDEVVQLQREQQTVALVSRGARTESGIDLSVAPEVLSCTDLLASVQGTSNLLLIETDLMGTVGTLSLAPGVEQTAYGLFSDLVDVAKSV